MFFTDHKTDSSQKSDSTQKVPEQLTFGICLSGGKVSFHLKAWLDLVRYGELNRLGGEDSAFE